MTALPSDAEARRIALAPDRSFCVQAPAGSGKTELLTQRLLKLLSICEQPEEILAITFTRKAAGEMQQRLLDSLQQTRASDNADDAALSPHKRHTRELARAALAQDAAQGWNLLDNPERLRLCTIDSFTSLLTSRLPFTANFGARPELTTDMNAILQQAARATLQSLDEETETGSAVATLLQHLHNDLRRAEGLLVELLKKRADWWPVLVPLRGNLDAARARLEQNLDSLLEEILEDISRSLSPFQHRLVPLLQYIDENLRAQGDVTWSELANLKGLPSSQPQAAVLWRQLANLLLTNTTGEFRSPKGLRDCDGFPAQGNIKDPNLKQRAKQMKEDFGALVVDMQAAGVLPACQALRCLPPRAYDDESWQVVDAILRLLPDLWAQLQVAMRLAGKIDHTETSLAALTALGSDEQPTDLALRLDYKLRHILVDEFQDTSHTQFRLLEKLTAGWQPGDGRTLFIVGDGMQSCYGFRNADVSLFLRARDNGIGDLRLEPLQLRVNFRSTANIVEWVNAVFSKAFPADDDVLRGGVKYSFSEAIRATGSAPGVNCQLLVKPARDTEAEDEDSTDKDTLRRDEAEAVATLCATLRQQHPDDHIAILVRGRTHLNEVVVALREKQIAWNASEIDALLSYGVIADLFTLLRALLNLSDITAWLALLRSPMIGLALTELEQLAQQAKQQQCTVWHVLQEHHELSLGTDARLRLQRCVPILQRARGLRQRVPLRTLLEQTWIELGGPSLVADASMLPNVAAFFALVEQQTDQEDILDIHDFEERLRSSHGSAQAAEVKLDIMTIHKSKGLEFDHVILCGLDRKPGNNESPLLRWRDFPDAQAGTRLLLGLTHKRGDDQDELYRFLKQEEDARQDYEATRLLYIGVTRAAKSAWLFGTVRETRNGFKADRKSLLTTVLPVLLADEQNLALTRVTPTLSSAPATAVVPFAPQTLQRLPANWHSPLAAPLLDDIEQQGADLPDEYDNLAARSIGNLIHLGLKLLVEQGPGALERSLDMPWWRLQLATLYPDRAEQDLQLAQLRERLLPRTRSTDAEWLFRRDHRADRCELELFDHRSSPPRRFVVDRTFVDDTGTRWIVDYKTAEPLPSQTRQSFLSEQAARYSGQLQTYAALLAAMDGSPTPSRLALYFTALGLLHELA